MKEKMPAIGGQNEKKELKGRNVKLHSFYFRHAEKASGAVGSGGSISKSLISEKGKIESVQLGAQLPDPAEHGFKIGWSGLERTLETGKSMAEGYLGDKEKKEFKPRAKKEISPDHLPEDFNKLYIEMFEENKKKILEKRGLSADDFSKLSTTEQAVMAEEADDGIIREWMENTNGELYKMYPPEKQAAHLAVLANRDIKMPAKLNSGSKIDLFRVTHRTITEPLLMKIIVLDNGEKPKKLDDIGGGMGLNDGWELECTTDADGKESVKLIMYRADRSKENDPVYIKKEFKIDLVELERLANEGLKLKNKID